MKPISAGLRRGLAGAFAVSAAGGVAATLFLGPTATAGTDPCAASEVAKTVGGVATNMGSYLDAHPQTNQALTTISQQQAGPQTLGAVKAYFDANPQVAKDMQQLQSPLVSLGTRCRLPVSLPQMMGLLQGAQQSAPAGVPSALSSTASAVSTGPLPGPAATPGFNPGALPGVTTATGTTTR
ncbi:hemophore [Mycobacterium sp. 852013-50091_SCH5140682]|uniref:hemophore n=1 Tax=Mycobacterium sp. 852013-50091_SCH5140682 TaxID=1834109 RepID=UPI0007EAE0FF|nr:hemophore [Mycobacterium sp. 852013-50091_SCH5140682]OBC14576.1 hemophore [Mycobacterium sp. 852013-50091_SCH5140682]